MTKKWAFFSYAHNMGDFTRAFEVAKAMKNSGEQVSFFNHGGFHLDWLAKQNIPFYNLLPEISSEQNDIVMAINQFRLPPGTPLPFSFDELKAMVEADLDAMATFKPDAAYCGLNISSMIAVPYLKLPMVTQVPTTLCPAFYERKLATFPNTLENNFVMRYLVPDFVKKRYFNAIMLKDVIRKTAEVYNQVRKHFGLPPVYNMIDFVKSDLVLLPDMEELSGLPTAAVKKPYVYTGPVFARFDDSPVPDEVYKVYQQPGLKIFLSLGSSGSPEIMKKLVTILRKNKEINLVCTTTTILNPDELGGNTDRFFACKFLPAHKVNEMADIAITHGGQGTIQTAAWAGTPVVGIGFQSEQQQNIDGLVRAGMAKRIKMYELNARRLWEAISYLQKEDVLANARRMKELVRATDGLGESVRLMKELVG
jgi:UDP:flavonoid glycosyltransferase YjiC (YdhE family)